MVHAHAALPRFSLDAKRIAATSGVIALHAGLLMMLMMPVRMAPAAPDAETGYTPPDLRKIVVEVPIEVKHQPPPILPHPQSVPVHDRVAAPDDQVEPVDQTVGALDTQAVDEPGPPADFQAHEEVSPFVQLSTIVAPAPPYPKTAEARRITGTVTLRIHVDAGGRPIEVLVQNSSGSTILDEAALKAVKARWRFVPATSGGTAVEAWALVPIQFVLD